MKLIRRHEYSEMPWKNGLGSTTEIAAFPRGSDTSHFLWRVSIARVDGSGPFSSFPGIDRIIVQLTGPVMRLHHPTLGKEHELTILKPYAFSGDVTTSASVAGPATDFNVMVRRTAFAAKVRVLDLNEQITSLKIPAGGVVLVYCVAGELIATGDTSEDVASGETIIGTTRLVGVQAAQEDVKTRVLIVTLSPTPS